MRSSMKSKGRNVKRKKTKEKKIKRKKKTLYPESENLVKEGRNKGKGRNKGSVLCFIQQKTNQLSKTQTK